MASTNRLSSNTVHPTVNGMSSTLDLLQKFEATVKKLERTHTDDINSLRDQIKCLEEENRGLHAFKEQHPNAAFSIDNISNDTISLQTQLDTARAQIKTLHEAFNQKCNDYDDLKSKYQLQRLMNENVQSTNHTNDSNSTGRVKELELQLKQLKDQIQQFILSHNESDEQIRLLKQILNSNNPSTQKTTAGLMVKQSDLSQQMTIVESILSKQHEKILSKIVELLGSSPSQTTTTKVNGGAKKLKKKRL